MERFRSRSPLYVRQKSTSSASGDSPVESPVRGHARAGSAGGVSFRRPQNTAARAAAQRLAQVMSHQTADDEDDDDDSLVMSPVSVSAGGGCRTGRPARSQSPRAGARSRSPALGRNPTEHPISVRQMSAGRPSVAAKPIFIVPPSKPFLKPQTLTPPRELPTVATTPELPTVATTPELPTVATPPELPASDNRRERRSPASIDLGILNGRDIGSQRSASALQDEANPADKIPSVDIVANKTSEKLSQNAICNFLENCKFVIAASQSVS